MPLVVEDKPVAEPTLLDEAGALLRTLNVGQSFLVPKELASAVRDRAKRTPGTFRSRAEGDQLRIGRVA